MWWKSEILQEVLRTDLIFQDGEFTDLPFHIKLLFDNLQVAFTLRQKPLFQKIIFKVLVSIAFIRTEDMTDDIWLSHKATWYESFGETKRVYEGIFDRYNPYPGLLINMETEDPVIYDPLWLSDMLEAGFISKLIITSGFQISLFPKVIQEVAALIGGLNYMKITIWSTLLA